MQAQWIRFALCAALWLGLASAGQAQTAPATPSAAQMVEQLKTAPRPPVRNLSVEAADTTPGPGASSAAAVPAAANPAPAPSLSLQILFDFNSSRVRPESQLALSNLAQALQSPELQHAKFAVEGHTDAKGAADYNLRLSQQRANAVCDILAQKGVLAGRLLPSGKGASDLANTKEPGAAENRRVRVINLN